MKAERGRGGAAGGGAAHLEVGVVEAVDDVPAQLQELLPLQQDAVEEAEREEQLPVEDGPRAALELLLCYQMVQTLHVGLQALWTDSRGQRYFCLGGTRKTRWSHTAAMETRQVAVPGTAAIINQIFYQNETPE